MLRRNQREGAAAGELYHGAAERRRECRWRESAGPRLRDHSSERERRRSRRRRARRWGDALTERLHFHGAGWRRRIVGVTVAIPRAGIREAWLRKRRTRDPPGG